MVSSSAKTLLSSFVVAASIAASAIAQSERPVNYRSITVVTEPRAQVWIDGVGWGRTDAEGKRLIKTISPGAHTIKVRADGFKEKSVPLAATKKGEVVVTLVKTTDEAELAFQEAERQLTRDREKAVTAYEKAIELRPSYFEAYIGLARVLTEMVDPDGALEAIRAARKLKPGNAEASAVEARIYKENGEPEKAVATFKRAIVEGKGFQPEAHAGLGIYYREKAEAAGAAGEYEAEDTLFAEAATNLRLSLKQLSGAPDTSVIYQLLGLTYERQKKYKEAIAVYEEFLQLFPESNDTTAVQSFIVQLKKQLAQKP